MKFKPGDIVITGNRSIETGNIALILAVKEKYCKIQLLVNLHQNLPSDDDWEIEWVETFCSLISPTRRQKSPDSKPHKS